MVFTSDLSTSDFYLLMEKGYMPMGLVVGNSVFSMGIGGSVGTVVKGITKGELPQLTELLYNAREMALTRMKKEAEDLGADGIIEVKLKLEYMHGGQWMEVTAVGTAIKKSEAKGTVSARAKEPPTVVIPVQSPPEFTSNQYGNQGNNQ